MPVTTIIDDTALVRMLVARLDEALETAESATTTRYMWDVGRTATETARVRLASVQRAGASHTSNNEIHEASWQAVLKIDVTPNIDNIYGPSAACAAVVSIFEGHYMWLGGTAVAPTHAAQVYSTEVDIQTPDNNDTPAMPATVTLRGKLHRSSGATMQDVLT